MNKLQTLIEQTSFLLDHQKQALADCEGMFGELLATVNTQAAKTSPETDEGEAINRIATVLQNQSDRLLEDASHDVTFLTEQLEALTKIAAVSDQTKRTEMLSMMIEDSEEIKDTAEFKQIVLEESAASKESLVAMLSDIKDAINEGNIEEVAEYLESVFGEDADGQDDDCCDDEECECDDDDGGCCDDEDGEGCGTDGEGCGCKEDGVQAGSCGGCNGCGEGGGCGSEPIDMFGSLKDYEESLLDKADDKTQH